MKLEKDRIVCEHRGFTMIEVLVAVLILTVGLLGTAAALGGVIQGNSKSKEMITAIHLAKDKMEEIRYQGYGGTSSVDAQITENYGSIFGYESFKRVCLVDAGNPWTDMKFFTVRIYWKGDSSSYTLNTILSR